MSKLYYETADGTQFYTENAAQNYARTMPEGQRAVKAVPAPLANVNFEDVDTSFDLEEEAEAEAAKKAQEASEKQAEAEAAKKAQEAAEKQVEAEAAKQAEEEVADKEVENSDKKSDTDKVIDLSTLSAKELKVIATERGLTFQQNASKEQMLQLLNA